MPSEEKNVPHGSLRLYDTLRTLDVRLSSSIRYDAMVVYLVRDGHLLPRYVSGDEFSVLSSVVIPIGEGLSGKAARNSTPIIDGDPSLDTAFPRDNPKSTTMRSGLAVPLEGGNGAVGVLTLYSRAESAFSGDCLESLLGVSQDASRAIENALGRDDARTGATTDALTRLPNARSLFARLDSELARCRRNQGTLGILACDVEGLRQVNELWGREEGDRLLRLVAQGIQESCREYDYVARLGGNKFVLVLPDILPEALPKKSGELREMVRRIGLNVCGKEMVALSVGDACYPSHGTVAEELLAHADQTMHRLKRKPLSADIQ